MYPAKPAKPLRPHVKTSQPLAKSGCRIALIRGFRILWIARSLAVLLLTPKTRLTKFSLKLQTDSEDVPWVLGANWNCYLLHHQTSWWVRARKSSAVRGASLLSGERLKLFQYFSWCVFLFCTHLESWYFHVIELTEANKCPDLFNKVPSVFNFGVCFPPR